MTTIQHDANGKSKEILRVFISYSHQDRGLVEEVERVLRENGLETLWDENFEFGHGFPEQIKNFIAHAHVFLPIITTPSHWVHQEIGYALALNVPVLPVCQGELPMGLAQQLHALVLSDDPKLWGKQLSRENLEKLVARAQRTSRPLYECADQMEDRTLMMVEYAHNVSELGIKSHVRVRQKGGLSSFQIPDSLPNHFLWQWRYGHRFSEFRCRLQRRERQVLEKHARKSGVSLIIDPFLQFRDYGELAMTARYYELLEFIESMTDEQAMIAVMRKEHQHREHHITIVGDWFMAEAAFARRTMGIRQTIFTRHAPSVRSRIEQFEEELQQILKENAVAPGGSRRAAAAIIRSLLQAEISRLLENPSIMPADDREVTRHRLEEIQAQVVKESPD